MVLLIEDKKMSYVICDRKTLSRPPKLCRMASTKMEDPDESDDLDIHRCEDLYHKLPDEGKIDCGGFFYILGNRARSKGSTTKGN